MSALKTDPGTAPSAGTGASCARNEERPNNEASTRLLRMSVLDYAIYMLDRRGRIASWSAGAERIKGYAAPEILGKHFSIFFVPDDQAAGEPLRRLLAAVDEGIEDEGWRVKKDGHRFWATAMTTPIRNRLGALIGFANISCEANEPRRRVESQPAELFRVAGAPKRQHDVVSRATRKVHDALVELLLRAIDALPGDHALAKLDRLDTELERLAIFLAETLKPEGEVRREICDR